MALTFSKWLSAAAVGCALLAVPISRYGTSDAARSSVAPRDLLNAAAVDATNDLNEAADKLRVLELRDSLAARVGGKPSPAATIFMSDKFSPEVISAFDRTLARLTRYESPHSVPMDVVFVLDSTWAPVTRFDGIAATGLTKAHRTHPGRVATAYQLPRAGRDEHCMVMLRVDPRAGGGTYFTWNNLPRRTGLAGPCAYYQAFGRPGAQIDKWMRERGWRLAERSQWNIPIPPRDPDSYRGRFFSFEGRKARDELQPAGVRCQAGDLAACEHALLDLSAQGMPTWGDGIIGPDMLQWWRGVELGAIDTQVLSEMVRTLGPEKFGQFWRSGESPAVAFKAAAGVSLGQWTHDLLVKTYGEQHLGPGVETAGVGMGLLLIALGLGLATVVAKRRTFA